MTHVLLPTPALPRKRTPPDQIRAPQHGHRAVLLAAPRGYCAGVDRAVEAVEVALDHYGPPVYVRKQIVHNLRVVESLAARGAIFVDEIDEIPAGARTVFSAHGVSPEVVAGAERRQLRTIDATCPLVTKVHNEAKRFAKRGFHIVMIGHAGHEEVEGTMGEVPGAMTLVQNPAEAATVALPETDKLVWVSQTTLSVDETVRTVAALRERFPRLADPPNEDICYATSNRQAAIKNIATEADLLLVLGSGNSSNTVRLVEVAHEAGARVAHRVENVNEVDENWLNGVATVGISSGASVPEGLVTELLELLAEYGFADVSEVEMMEENTTFAQPAELRRELKAAAARGDR